MALPFGLKPGLKAKTVVTTAVDPADPAKGNMEAEFSAICLANAIVYKLNGKPIKTDEVPQAVKDQLQATMLVGVKAEAPAELAPPAPEQAAGIDPARVVDEASVIDPAALPPVPADVPVESTPAAPNPMYQPSPLEDVASIAEAAAALDKAQDDDLGFDDVPAPTIDLAAELEAAEARSVDNVNLRELARVLYERFGVYTVYLNVTPTQADISPLTGTVMNMLSLGQANQGFKTAQRLGTSWNPNAIKSQITTSRALRGNKQVLPKTIMQEHQVVGDPYGAEVDMPNLHGEPSQPRYHVNRSYDSPHQSALHSVRGREGDGTDPDEIYAEPPINARTSIVRPFVNNERSQKQLEHIARTRAAAQPAGRTNFSDLV